MTYEIFSVLFEKRDTMYVPYFLIFSYARNHCYYPHPPLDILTRIIVYDRGLYPYPPRRRDCLVSDTNHQS